MNKRSLRHVSPGYNTETNAGLVAEAFCLHCALEQAFPLLLLILLLILSGW